MRNRDHVLRVARGVLLLSRWLLPLGELLGARRYFRAALRGVARSLMGSATSGPPNATENVEESDLLEELLDYDAETLRWVEGVLHARNPLPAIDPADPEALHDALRLRGVLPALARLCTGARRPRIEEHMAELLRHTAQLSDTIPCVGWDPTTAALRLLSLLETAEVLEKNEVALPWRDGALRRFVEDHEPILALGNALEPAGNHRMIHRAGRAALGFLLRPSEAIPAPERDETARVFREQFLADGGQLEGCPHYHLQTMILMDGIARIDAGRGGMLGARIEDVREAARSALCVMLDASGRLLRFGDASRSFSGRLEVEEVKSLFAGHVPEPLPGRALLPRFGIATWRWNEAGTPFLLAIDCGSTGLAENPGHGHADGLSYCLNAGDEEVVVDSGTYLYAESAAAKWFKLPEAHASVCFPRHPSHALGRYFRWHRTPHPVTLSSTESDAMSARQEWHRLACSHSHRRTWRRSGAGLEVVDRVATTQSEPACVRIPLSPSASLSIASAHVAQLRLGPFRVGIEARGDLGGACRRVPAWYAPRYGERCAAEALEFPISPRRGARELALAIEVS